MTVLFEVIKFLFFGLSIAVWLLLTQWQEYLASGMYQITQQILLPGYLVFCGLMIGYIITQLTMPAYIADKAQEKKLYARGFMIGLWIWFIIALIYVFY